MMQFFKRKAKSKGRVGVVVHPSQLAFVHMQDQKGVPHLLRCERVALESEKGAAAVLNKLVKDFELEGTECSFVLNPSDYNLHLVEAPKVEPAELRAAVRWKIKDLLDMKVDDAAIDVFPVPADAYRGREMVYVVATLKSRIKSIVEMVTDSGLELAVIDIPELVMKNLSSLFVDDSNGIAYMDLRRTGSTMNIMRGGELYLTRRINTQLDPDVMDSPEWESVKDRLVLEIQRSLDYYESQMGKGQINRIVIAQRQHDTVGLIESLNALLAAEVSALDLNAHLLGDVTLTSELQQISSAAIGATLRGMKSIAAEEIGSGAGSDPTLDKQPGQEAA